MSFNQGETIKFLEGQSLKASLVLIPLYATKNIFIMVPYLGQGEILTSILNIPSNINVYIYTRNRKGYLPSIKNEADPTLKLLAEKTNIHIFIDNNIHAKIWLIDESLAIVHSMNGTYNSENFNLEAGIMTNDKKVIQELHQFFIKSHKQAKKA
jgi:phosphatidylserine/phosphatidylglycerophosphate/cardiolipin synthase-like enzyme